MEKEILNSKQKSDCRFPGSSRFSSICSVIDSYVSFECSRTSLFLPTVEKLISVIKSKIRQNLIEKTLKFTNSMINLTTPSPSLGFPRPILSPFQTSPSGEFSFKLEVKISEGKMRRFSLFALWYRKKLAACFLSMGLSRAMIPTTRKLKINITF